MVTLDMVFKSVQLCKRGAAAFTLVWAFSGMLEQMPHQRIVVAELDSTFLTCELFLRFVYLNGIDAKMTKNIKIILQQNHQLN